MKILFTLIPAFNPTHGGVQQTTFKLGKFFHENNCSVVYFSMVRDGHIDVLFGKLVHVLEEGLDRNPKNLLLLQETIRLERPDIIINQMPYETRMRMTIFSLRDELDFLSIACLRNALFSVKNNIEAYAQQVLPFRLHFLLANAFGRQVLQLIHRYRHNKELKQILELHDYFVLLAPPNRLELEYFVGNYGKDKVITIPNSIPSVSVKPIVKKKVILYIGRINSTQKRCDLLLPVWKNIHPILNDWKFVIVGDGPYKNNIDQQIESEEIPRVETCGFQDPNAYFEEAAILLMTSAYEGFPNVVIEAQSFGVIPVVFSSYPAIEWILHSGHDSLLVKPFHVQEMAEAVISIAKNEDLQRNMAKSSKVNASQFIIERVGNEWLNFFKDLRMNE